VTLQLRTCAGEVLPLPLERWLGPPTIEEETVLGRVVGPALDVGCGPGRHVLALARRGVVCLGIDVAGTAVELARRRGAPVLERSVFDRVPGAGRWGSALLLDGNVGIGGDPTALVRRVRALLRPGGRLLVEVEPPGTAAGTGQARLELAGRPGPWFPWARVQAGDVPRLAGRSDCTLAELWQEGRRWFAQLDAG
jgi:SAM-dependent methyltransferase